MSDLVPTSNALTTAEQRKLKLCERKITDGVANVMTAFQMIRDERLYRETHKSFEAYCKDVWKLSRRTVDRKISFELAVAEAETHGSQPPANERQSRGRTTIAKTPEIEVTDKEVEDAEDAEWTPVVDPVKHIEQALADLTTMSEKALLTDPILLGHIVEAFEKLRAFLVVEKFCVETAEEEEQRHNEIGETSARRSAPKLVAPKLVTP